MRPATRAVLVAALAGSLAASCGTGPPAMQGNRFDLGGPREGIDPDILRADPSRVVAAELAFARAAQEKGQWTAFAEFATDDAVMFVPEAVTAQAWLKGRANPPQAVRWQPYQVWSSCDGSLAVTKGAWQRPDGSVGYFTTVWERQGKGEYRWVLDQGDVLEQPLATSEMIEARTAECPNPMQYDAVIVDPPRCGPQGCSGSGRSGDDTLEFRYDTRPNGARSLRVSMLTGGKMEQVLLSEVAAE
jgi:hypothetical protein